MSKFFKLFNNFSLFNIRLIYDIVFFLFAFHVVFNYKNFNKLDIHYQYENFYFLLLFLSIVLLQNILTRNISFTFEKKAIIFFSLNFLGCYFFYTESNLIELIKFYFLLSAFQLIPRYFTQSYLRAGDTLLNRVITSKGPVLIIGGARYIGSHLIKILLDNKRKVRILDNFMYGRDSFIAFQGNPNLEIIEGECHDLSKLIPAMDGVYAVIHLAGLVGDPACAVNPELTRYTNIVSTKVTFSTAESMGVKRFIFASSCSVYGVSDSKVNESSKLNPVSLYAESKIDSEKELLSLGSSSKINLTILRFATVFGDSYRPRFDLVANIFSANVALNKNLNVFGPSQWRPFIHVFDIARAINIVLNANIKSIRNEIFNVGDEKLNMTLGDLANKIVDTAKKIKKIKSKIILEKGNPGDLRNYMVSFKKIKKNLGFEASISIEKGAEEIIRNFVIGKYKNPSLIKYSNFLTTKKYVSIFNKKISKFEKIPILYT